MSVSPATPGAQASGGGSADAPGHAHAEPSPVDRLADLAPVGFMVVLLVLATWFAGAFAIRHWAPVALLVLITLAVGAHLTRPRLEHVPAIAIFALALWMLLSTAWAELPGAAVEGAGRTMLYAGLVASAVLLVSTRQAARRLADLIVLGLGAVVAATLITVLVDAPGAFLAGRLNAPVDYRNGTAVLLGMAFWGMCCVGASRDRPLLLRVPACSLTAIALGLVFLTQSRGALLGVVAGGAVTLALGPERLRRVWVALAAALGVALFADPLLEPYNAFLERGAARPADLAQATSALVVLAAGAAVVALLGGLFDHGLRATDRAMRVARRVALTALLVLTLGGAVAAVAAVGDPVALVAERIEEFRSLDATAPGETRLGSAGGQRYDLWRVGWNEFTGAPLLGVGEGSFSVGYYQQRRTNRNLTTPHSLPLELAAETGVIGLGLLVIFVGAVAVVLVRGARRSDHRARRDASMLAAIGTVVLAQSTVDWLWLIPGVTGMGLLALGLAVRVSAGDDTAPAVAHRLPRVGFAVVASAAALVIAALIIADFFVREARGSDAPESRLEAARTAETFDPLAVSPLRLQAGALEGTGRVAEARAALQEAIVLEPRNFVGYALLADLELRAGRAAVAERLYRRALALNPGDVGLRQLVALAQQRQRDPIAGP